MSGGSFSYLCYKEPEDLFNNIDLLEEMETALGHMGARDIAKDTRRLTEYVISAQNRIEVLLGNLQDVFHAVEWYHSGDYGRDSVEKAFARYREEVGTAEAEKCKGCGYKFHSQEISKLPDCNDCGRKDCKYMPNLGEWTRINCPLHTKKEAEP